MLNDLLVTFSEDGYVKYHSFGMQQGQLSLQLEREIDTKQTLTAGLATSKFLYLGCADNNVRVHFADTFKFKLALYGHSLPVLQIQESFTGEKLFTTSADKTVRVWGLTFGECLRHIKLMESPTQLAIVPATSLAFIATAAGLLLYYDLDSYTQICRLGEGNYGKRF